MTLSIDIERLLQGNKPCGVRSYFLEKLLGEN